MLILRLQLFPLALVLEYVHYVTQIVDGVYIQVLQIV
jgi:hypothetical protein